MANPFKDWTPQMVEDYNRRDSSILAGNDAFGKRFEKVGVDSVPEKAERELHAAIVNECKLRGWLYFHGSTAQKTARTLGEPDFHIYAPTGRHFCVECKSKDGKLSSDQQGVQRWLAKLGHETYVLRTIEEFIAICDGKQIYD